MVIIFGVLIFQTFTVLYKTQDKENWSGWQKKEDEIWPFSNRKHEWGCLLEKKKIWYVINSLELLQAELISARQF